ncbi:MAG: 16S rRNA (uracil(1498)-N(3))-methyltransferase [Christensenella sp.]|uniref:16S rRNA (uracil(1498)-N(3))-methyltransferase n=1 Tax=Christensenella sp. TaxID=1935934 RepID=UPI002B1F70F3|nr:16S rRNA (uracil(1498)-N(3))-methyltransferase [Christensenella sp.]MEA5003131.1 16S rRNA (uracil(1498)-N(3))-methyltransferase [Christensenella sp.]
MRRFFTQQVAGDTVTVTGQEAKHMARVLRMEEGDELILFDGSGVDYTGRITAVTAEAVEIEVLSSSEAENEPRVRIHICQAVIKSDHLDYVVQKCTEMGAYGFLPFLSDRCVKRPDEKSAAKLVERERRIALEAAKQCGRSRVPKVDDILTGKALAARLKEAEGLVLLAYEDEKKTQIRQVLEEHPNAADIYVVIGPEGGFAASEVLMLQEAGAKVCSLGRLILRSETAGLAAAAMIGYHLMEGKS